MEGHSSGALSKRKPTTMSVVWNYFDLIEAKGKVNCLLCKQELSYNRNTSVVRERLKRKHVHVKLNEVSKDDKRYAIFSILKTLLLISMKTEYERNI